jgi:hypothetical protein
VTDSRTPRPTLRRLLVGLLAALGLLALGTATAPAALACPPAGCGHLPGDEDPPPPNPNPQPPAPRYQFVIDKIDLLDLHDGDGGDEPIIKLDGQTKIANIGYTLGVHTLYAPIVQPSFTTYASVEVRENTPNWFDSQIGTLSFYAPNPPLSAGASTDGWADVWGSGAHYRLHYRYTRI